MNVYFRFCFVFSRKWNFIFIGIFARPKMKNAFWSVSIVYITKGLGFEKSLDYMIHHCVQPVRA